MLPCLCEVCLTYIQSDDRRTKTTINPKCNADAHLIHESKILINVRFQGVQLGHQRMLETPKNLLNCSGHEDIDALGVHPDGHRSAKEK